MFGFAKYLWLLLIFCTIFDCGRSQTLVTKTSARIVTYTIPELKENREVLKNIVHEEIFVHTKTNERIRGYLDGIQMDSLVVRLDKNNGEKYSIHERNVSFIALRVNGGGIEAHKLVEMIGVVFGVRFIIYALHQLGNTR